MPSLNEANTFFNQKSSEPLNISSLAEEVLNPISAPSAPTIPQMELPGHDIVSPEPQPSNTSMTLLLEPGARHPAAPVSNAPQFLEDGSLVKGEFSENNSENTMAVLHQN